MNSQHVIIKAVFPEKIFARGPQKKLASRIAFAYTSFRAEVVELVDTLS